MSPARTRLTDASRLGSAALALFAAWLASLLAGGASLPLDVAILNAMRPAQRNGLVDLAALVTWMGDGAVLIPLMLVAAGFLVLRRRGKEALALLAATLSVRLLVTLQKGWFDHARPDVGQWALESSSGFPSGHAANSFITYVALAMLLTRSRGAVVGAVAFSLTIGLSRLVLGVHWPTDVIGGWATGGLAALALALWRSPHQWNKAAS